MAGFRKAKAEQAALKMGFYGLAGSGKTFTALLVAEGLAKYTGKRVAVVDTEHGTDWYSMDIPERKVHPEAFDFDALYTRSITETFEAIKGLSPEKYCCIVVDSVTHLWESAKNAYDGKLTKIGTFPIQAWGKIKKPYAQLLTYLLSSPMHVLLCGRQGNEWETDEDTDEMKKVGTKMKAEGETPYEPHVLCHMESLRKKDGQGIVTLFAEKDRTGILSGRVIQWPNFENVAKPLLGALGKTQATIPDADETSNEDAERLLDEEKAKIEKSGQIRDQAIATFTLCKTSAELLAAGKLVTPEVKKQMLTADVSAVREAWIDQERKLKGGLV